MACIAREHNGWDKTLERCWNETHRLDWKRVKEGVGTELASYAHGKVKVRIQEGVLEGWRKMESHKDGYSLERAFLKATSLTGPERQSPSDTPPLLQREKGHLPPASRNEGPPLTVLQWAEAAGHLGGTASPPPMAWPASRAQWGCLSPR